MRIRYLGIMAAIAMALAVLALPATANLVSTTFGFPVIVQNGSTSAFNQDTAFAQDYENINIDIPTFASFDNGDLVDLGATAVNLDGASVTSNVLPFGSVNLAFPSISQTVNQVQNVTHTDFAQTNEFAEFAYPFVGVGDVSLPGFGFGY